MEGERGSCSSGTNGNRGLEGLHAIANFYDKLCPAWEEAVPDVRGGTVPRNPHDNIMEGVQRAMQSVMDVMEGRLKCQELEAMGLSCVEGSDILSLIQVATFHAYWHRFTAWTGTNPPCLVAEQAVATDECGQMALVRSMDGAMQLQRGGGPSMTGFCMSHSCAVWGWIGLEETYGGTNYARDVVWMKGALHASNQLAGLRSELCFPLRYALGEFLYMTAFQNCNGDEEKQTILLNMAVPELMAYGRDCAEESEVVLDVFTVFSRAGKAAIKLQKGLSEMMEIYNEATVYARKLGQGEWERLLSLLCLGLQELENDSIENHSMAAAFKIFVEVLKSAVKLADKGGDLVSKYFDLLSHACWWTNKSMRLLKIGHMFPRLILPTLDEFVRASVGTCKALLGGALFVLGQEVEGLHYLECVHKMVADDKLDPTLHQSQKFLAQSYAGRHAARDHRKAAEMYEAASKTAPDLQTQLTMDVNAASEWVKVPQEFARGLKGMQVVVRIALQRLPHEWEFRAFLFFKIGGALLDASHLERGVEHLESGWSLCAENDLAFALGEEKIHSRDIVVGLARLICAYLYIQKLSAALSLYKAVDPILANLRSTTNESPVWTDTAWRCWQQALEALYLATGFPADDIPQWETPSGRYSWILESVLNEDIGGGNTYLFAAADHYEDMVAKKSAEGDWRGAVNALDILEEKTLQRGVLSTKAKLILQVNRAWILWGGREFLHAEKAIQKAVDMMLDMEADPWLLTEIYMMQACVYWKLENPDAAHASLNMAEKNLSNGKDKYWRHIMELRSLLLQKAGQYEAAAQLSFEVAHSYRAAQVNLGLESAWVPFLERTAMPKAFKTAAIQYVLQKDMSKALIWTERGRTRLFMHRVNQLEAEKFDENDQYAEDILYKTIELCAPSTVIIECSLFHPGVVLSALVNHPVVGKRCASKFFDLNTFFQIEANRAAGKSIMEVVVNVRKYISGGNDGKAMPGLTILHSILVQSILDQYHELRNCTSIIFAPEGMLHLIPFAALYDGFAEKFLIEQKAVGVIPSIRSLHRCFSRQQILENRVRVLDDAFIAGNPEPMGLELSQLAGAAEEAQQVAEILGVEACKGEDITKEAVGRALAKSSVVLLATHGINQDHLNPYGGIVLKRAHLSNDSEARECRDPTMDQQEVLTFDEIAETEGGISAGLVVISACCRLTMKNVFEEGLLSLGHAVLQGGAASAIVSLWNVNDNAMRILIVDVFKELKKGTDVVHSVQKAMVKMLRGPEPNKLKHWSALMVLGSPTFQLPGYKQDAEVKLKQHNIDYYRGSQLAADDFGGNVMYPRAIVHQFQNMVWQREDEGNWAAAIATVDALEERLEKNGTVSVVAKSKLHLWRGKYLNQSKGGAWKALKELQKAVEVLPDIEEMPELVAEIFLERAKAFFRMKDQDATSNALEKAQESVAKCKDSMLLYNIKVFRSFALNEAGEFKSAAALARETQLHAGLGNTPVWVPFVDDAGLKNPFSYYEIESGEQGDANKALAWAERGRTTVPEDAGDDNTVIRNMLKTAKLCGPEIVIIYLSYHHQNMLLLYGFSFKASACIRLFLKKFFSNEENCVMGASLEEVVSRVRQHISKGEDQKAIPGLSILYKLVVQNIVVEFKQLFASSTEIIFAPQGFLCQIPFAALYDSSTNKFLVEQVAVGVIPSISSLSRCFSQQEKFESDFKLKEESGAFVSGNPEPMALGLEQLPGTCEVAKAVGGIMNLEAFPGSKLSKEVLLEALVTRSIVMLATHSIGGHREQPYPYAAMVLKQDTIAAPQLLTCEDIAALEGKIKAGLVVLISCCKGDGAGTLSRDGLLGLGHAALEAGAVSTIASLWDVNEDALQPLISAIFTELLQGSDVLHSVQKGMTDVLKSREIRHWAALTVLGSPTLRIYAQPQSDVAAPESEKMDGSEDTTLAMKLDSLRKDCLESFTVNTDDGPTTLDKLSQGIVERVLHLLVERFFQQILQAEGEGDLTTEILQCSNLGWVYGGMGEWTTCREWLVRSVSVAKENWEKVKDDDNVLRSLPNSGMFISNLLRLHGSTNMDLDLELAKFVKDMVC